MTSNSSPQVLLEGLIKHRDNRKWKSRWAVVSKLSPVADCLHINLYRSCKDKFRNTQPRQVILLQSYLGIESGFTLERDSNTLAIICKEVTVVFCFDTREILHQWQIKLQCHFCKEQHYLVHIIALPPKSKLACGPARLLLQDFAFCLVSGIPPRLLGYWPLEQLRRFGPVEGKFCFEGGSLCGKGTGLHVLYTNQAEELSKCFELASCGQLNSLNTQTNECHEYYRKSGENLLYKYANVGNSKEGHKSASSDSSTCDSCSHILNLSIADENSRSNYYLNLSGANCGLYHSSFTLNCHEQLSRQTADKVSNVSCHRRPDSICNANSHCKCHCRSRSSTFGANTISRLSNVKCNSAKCIAQDCFSVSGQGSHLCSLPSPSDTLKPSSPSTTSLTHCLFASDQESLFSQSSQGSSNSSSGCSSLACTEHNRTNNQNLCLQVEGPRVAHTKPNHLMQGNLVQRTNHERIENSTNRECPCVHDGFINGRSPSESVVQCEKWAHLYSQINFIKRNSQSDQMANYDIPRNLCVNAALFNQNKESLVGINHGHCDSVHPNEPARDCKPQIGDSFMHDSFDHLGRESTLVRQHTKHHFLQPQPACVPDNETNKLGSALRSTPNTNCRQSEDSKGEQSSKAPANTEHCHTTTQPPAEPNYANMQFINSMPLYENMCFGPHNRNSNWSIGKLAHSEQGDEFISEASSPQTSQCQIESQSPNQSVDCARDCLCHSDECKCGERGTDSAPTDELFKPNTNETEQTVMNGTDESMNGPNCRQSAHSNHSVLAEDSARHSDSEKDKCAEGETYQNGNISHSGPRGGSKRANNGEHYRPHDRKEVNISLSSSSSLHNRVGCKHQVGTSTKQGLCSTRAATKWSISNAIRSQQRHHHCGKSLLRPKSYSIDDITSTEPFFKDNQPVNRFGSAGEWLCCANGLTDHHLHRKHKSDQVLSAAKRNRRFPCEDQDRLLNCSCPDSDSESEDFCTSSQITVLCHSQTEVLD